MLKKKRIVCLANSYMPGGRCVAGKELIDGEPNGWIRLIGEEEGVPDKEFREVKLLDIIDVPLVASIPIDHQKENWSLDTDARPSWERSPHTPWEDPKRLVDPVKPLWIDGCSTGDGEKDMIPYSKIGGVDSSLFFIKVKKLTLFPLTHKVVGMFEHSNVEYRLKVTDPNYKNPNSGKFDDGKCEIFECFLTVSLAGRYWRTNACHKLIAAIIPHRK